MLLKMATQTKLFIIVQQQQLRTLLNILFRNAAA